MVCKGSTGIEKLVDYYAPLGIQRADDEDKSRAAGECLMKLES